MGSSRSHQSRRHRRRRRSTAIQILDSLPIDASPPCTSASNGYIHEPTFTLQVYTGAAVNYQRIWNRGNTRHGQITRRT